jgi:hypothetical protein
MAIANRANADGVMGVEGDQSKCPKRATIATEATVHENTVNNWLPLLAKAGELEYTVYGNGRGRHTVYRVLLPLDDVALTPFDTTEQGNDVALVQNIDTSRMDVLEQRIGLLAQQVQVLAQAIATIGTTDRADAVDDPRIFDPINPENTDPPAPPGGTGGDAPPETAKGKKPKADTPRATAASPPIPEALNTAAFLARWRSWLKHRSEIRKPVTATTAEKQLKQLEGWGVQRAITAIDHSIANGWQGIFEPKPGVNGRGAKPRPAADNPQSVTSDPNYKSTW